MYKYIVKKNASLPQISENRTFTLTEINDISNLVEVDSEFNFVWTSPEHDVYSFTILKDLIICEVDDRYTLARNIENLEVVYIFNKSITIFEENCDEKFYYYNTKKLGLVKFDYLKGKIDKIFLENRYEGLHKLLGDFLALYKNGIIYIHKKSDFSLLWKKDIRDFFNKEDTKDNQLRIQEIYVYKDNFIVVSTFGVLCLSQQDGSLLWKTESYARTMEIVGNFGYVCTSICLYRINLDNGEVYDYQRQYARLPDFEYEGKTYWAAGHRVVYQDGLLWYLVYHSGDSFVIAINPETANYQWIHKIDTYEKADKIQFHNDKMFISGSGGNLFIYER